MMIHTIYLAAMILGIYLIDVKYELMTSPIGVVFYYIGVTVIYVIYCNFDRSAE